MRAAIAAERRRHRQQQPRPGQPGRGRQARPRPPASRSSTSTRPTRRAGFDAYVGGDIVEVGRRWAQYLVDKGLVKQGDFVWLPVEVPGATYGVQEEEGIASVLEPLGRHLGGHRQHARPGRGHHPHDRLPDRQPRQDQGDHRARRHGDGQRSSACSTRSASPPARSRWSAGATRSTPPRPCSRLRQRRACGRTRRRPATSACRWRRWRRRHPAGLRHHHRRPLREGHCAALRRHHVAASSSSRRRRVPAPGARTSKDPP